MAFSQALLSPHQTEVTFPAGVAAIALLGDIRMVDGPCAGDEGEERAPYD